MAAEVVVAQVPEAEVLVGILAMAEIKVLTGLAVAVAVAALGMERRMVAVAVAV
jgi:hypothetical protein